MAGELPRAAGVIARPPRGRERPSLCRLARRDQAPRPFHVAAAPLHHRPPTERALLAEPARASISPEAPRESEGAERVPEAE